MQIDICYADWYLLWVLTLWILQTWVIKIVISLPFHFKTVLVKQSMVMEAADWNAKTRTVKQNSPNRKNSTLYTKRTEQMFGAWQQCLISCMSNQFTLSAFSMNLKDLYPRATKAHRVHWRINSRGTHCTQSIPNQCLGSDNVYALHGSSEHVHNNANQATFSSL